MIELILKLLGTGLDLWASKEKAKYQDRYIKLKQELYAEYNKPDELRSDATLDALTFELRLLGDSFSAQAGNENPKIKP